MVGGNGDETVRSNFPSTGDDDGINHSIDDGINQSIDDGITETEDLGLQVIGEKTDASGCRTLVVVNGAEAVARNLLKRALSRSKGNNRGRQRSRQHQQQQQQQLVTQSLSPRLTAQSPQLMTQSQIATQFQSHRGGNCTQQQPQQQSPHRSGNWQQQQQIQQQPQQQHRGGNCPHCGKFILKLSEHIKEVHGEDRRKYSCQFCASRFKRDEHLRKHLTGVHKWFQ